MYPKTSSKRQDWSCKKWQVPGNIKLSHSCGKEESNTLIFLWLSSASCHLSTASILPFASKAGGRTGITLLFRGKKLVTCISEQGCWSRQNPTPCSQQNVMLCLGASKDTHIMLSSSFLAVFAGLSVVVSPFQVLEPQGAAAMATHGSSSLSLSQLWK